VSESANCVVVDRGRRPGRPRPLRRPAPRPRRRPCQRRSPRRPVSRAIRRRAGPDAPGLTVRRVPAACDLVGFNPRVPSRYCALSGRPRRPVAGRRRARTRRLGHGVQRGALAVGAMGGGQDPEPRGVRAPGGDQAVPPRGAGDLGDRPRQRGRGDRDRPAPGRVGLLRDGAAGRREPGPDAQARGPPPWSRVRHIVLQLCGALAAAHYKGESTATSSPRTASASPAATTSISPPRSTRRSTSPSCQPALHAVVTPPRGRDSSACVLVHAEPRSRGNGVMAGRGSRSSRRPRDLLVAAVTASELAVIRPSGHQAILRLQARYLQVRVMVISMPLQQVPVGFPLTLQVP